MLHYTVILGMGKTGLACARFLTQQGVTIQVMDSRLQPPGLATLTQELPDLPYLTGRFDADILAGAQEIVISPGISLHETALQTAITNRIPIISEIELFARHVNAPVVGITGSNGKSTVTSWVGEMARHAGWQVPVGGNLGTPALELLCSPAPDLYVLELSSFQLETTFSLNPQAAVVLNLSEDHIDHHLTFAQYAAAKERIFQGHGVMVLNADEAQVMAMERPGRQTLTFSLQDSLGDFRVKIHQGEPYLAMGDTPLLPVAAMKLRSGIMQANALAALALAEAVGIPMAGRLTALQEFAGLPHRCQWVANKGGIEWLNDSKGTNVGATVAALQGLGKPKQVILIAGGEGKGADFSPLQDAVAKNCRACVLIGRDGPLIAQALGEVVPLYWAKSMAEAVKQAALVGHPGDTVLLSPACASFDMFKNYEHRGEEFAKAVLDGR